MSNLGQKFGAGVIIATAQYDVQGNAFATPTPYRVGILQDVSTEFSFEKKPLYGSNQIMLDAGRGKAKLAFSAKMAQINGAALARLHFGATPSVGYKGPVIDSAQTVPATSPYTVTITPPSTGTFVADLGVTDTSGTTYTRVASAPTTGQYAVSNAGVYTFAAADTGKALLVSYEYSASTGGIIMPLTNQLMGASPQFSVLLYNESRGSKLAVKLTACISDKLAIPFKSDDFAIADFGWEAMDDGTGSAGYWSQT